MQWPASTGRKQSRFSKRSRQGRECKGAQVAEEQGHTCMRTAACDTAATTTPQTARPAMTPPLLVPAHAAKMKIANWPYTEYCKEEYAEGEPGQSHL